MDFIKENRAAVVVAVLIAGMVTLGVLSNNSSDTNKGENTKQANETKDKASEDKAKDSDDTTKKDGKDLSFTAASGDSYTTLARQAVQDADSSLSKAQVIAAETYLAQAAGEPAVDVGEVVLVKQADLNKAVKKAKNLSKADIAAWNAYVPYVQF